MWPLTNGLRCLIGSEASLLRSCVGMMLDSLEDQLGTPSSVAGCEQVAGESDGGFGFLAPQWYAMWEPSQRLWLLERVTMSLLTARSAPPHSAIFEATIEAIYIELADLIALEITGGSPIQRGSWRASLLDAYVQRCPEDSLLGGMHFEATTLDPCLPPSIAQHWNASESEDGGTSGDESASVASPRQIGGANPLPSARNPSNPSSEPDWLRWWTSVIERLVDATYGPRLYHGAEQYRDGDPERLTRYLRGKGVNEKFMQRIPPLRSIGQTQAAIERLHRILRQGS